MRNKRQQQTSKPEAPPPPGVPTDEELGLDGNESVGELAAHGEQLAVERAKLAADQKRALAESQARVAELKRVQDVLESRQSVIEAFRAEDGPELTEVHFHHTINVAGTKIRDQTSIRVIHDLRGDNPPKLIDMAAERKLVVVVPGKSSSVFPYEGIRQLVYAPMAKKPEGE